MSGPLVSVIMPVHNAARFVAPAVHSVLEQTYPNLELIAIDDASTDNSRAILEAIADPRIRLFRNSTRFGAAETKNRGIAEARGELLAFLDADDVAFSHRLARQVDWLRSHPSVDLLGSSIEHIDQDGRSLGCFDLAEPHPEALRIRLLFENRLAQSTVIVRRAVLDTHRFRREFEPAEDYDLWVRLASKGSLAVLRDILISYRVHDQNTSRDTGAMAGATHAVQVAQLSKLGICDPDAMLTETVASDSIPSLRKMSSIEQWLMRLRQANAASGRFDARALDQELSRRWLAVGFRAARLGVAAWARWRQSLLAPALSAGGLRLLVRSVRWELARTLGPS